MYWQTSRYQIDLTRPKVMGIVNVTPDSFSDGGQHGSTQAALRHCEQLIRDGADILDIGGESTRPGAPPVSLEDELARVIPVLREATQLGVPVSVDSYKPRVMQAVLDLGADIINDIWALRWQDAAGSCTQPARDSGGGGAPQLWRLPDAHAPRTPDHASDAQCRAMWCRRCAPSWSSSAGLQALGVDKARIMLDPGIGFGKTVAQNFALLARQAELLQAGYPLLAGWSRKSSLAGMVSHTTPSGHVCRRPNVWRRVWRPRCWLPNAAPRC